MTDYFTALLQRHAASASDLQLRPAAVYGEDFDTVPVQPLWPSRANAWPANAEQPARASLRPTQETPSPDPLPSSRPHSSPATSEAGIARSAIPPAIRYDRMFVPAEHGADIPQNQVVSENQTVSENHEAVENPSTAQIVRHGPVFSNPQIARPNAWSAPAPHPPPSETHIQTEQAHQPIILAPLPPTHVASAKRVGDTNLAPSSVAQRISPENLEPISTKASTPTLGPPPAPPLNLRPARRRASAPTVAPTNTAEWPSHATGSQPAPASRAVETPPEIALPEQTAASLPFSTTPRPNNDGTDSNAYIRKAPAKLAYTPGRRVNAPSDDQLRPPPSIHPAPPPVVAKPTVTIPADVLVSIVCLELRAALPPAGLKPPAQARRVGLDDFAARRRKISS